MVGSVIMVSVSGVVGCGGIDCTIELNPCSSQTNEEQRNIRNPQNHGWTLCQSTLHHCEIIPETNYRHRQE